MTTLSQTAAATIALLAIAAPTARAQAIAHGAEPPPHRLGTAAGATAERYRIRLVSAWPDLPAGAGCENGGTETLEGILARTGPGAYGGRLERSTHLLFCGTHGAAAEPCALVLDGRGTVAMHGVVVVDTRSPTGRALRVTWTPEVAHTARVTGACGAGFKAKVERMYLTVRHGAEFALPNAGAAPTRERLEDYAWVVEIE